MKTFFKIAAVILLTGLLSSSLSAWFIARSHQPNLSKAEALIEQTTQNQVTILSHFASVGNIEGFVISTVPSSEKRGILYVDNAGQYLINGSLMSATGQDLTQQDFYQYVQPNAVETAYEDIANTAWIQQGSVNAAHKLYVITDPNCLFCHHLFVALQPSIAAGKLAVRWIVVGLGKPSSRDKALSILNTKNPLEGLKQNEQLFDTLHSQGGILGISNPSAGAIKNLNANSAFLLKNQLTQTPTLFFKDRHGNPRIQIGVPSQAIADFLEQTSGSF